jgi:hypothetical protein
MRSLALTALLGSFIVCASLTGQSLTEHAAAAAGGTIGTAAGKPLGKALGNIFGNVDKSTTKAATSKSATPATKPSPVAPTETVTPTATVVIAPSGVGGGDIAAGGGGGGSSHRSARRRAAPARSEGEAAAPISAPIAPLAVEPVIKEPTAQDVASVRVGATAVEMRAALGAPESKVSIPDDDGHLREICQYWAKGEPLATIRLDNGRVVSVQTAN